MLYIIFMFIIPLYIQKPDGNSTGKLRMTFVIIANGGTPNFIGSAHGHIVSRR